MEYGFTYLLEGCLARTVLYLYEIRSTRYGVRHMLYKELIKNAYKSDITAQLISLQSIIALL